MYAIDTSTYIRSDAETSPERGVYYHSSRHSAGKPVVAGWSYSWCAQLGDYSSSWTAPVDVSRVPIELDAHDIAGRQMQAVTALSSPDVKPLFAFDAGYDSTRLSTPAQITSRIVWFREVDVKKRTDCSQSKLNSVAKMFKTEIILRFKPLILELAP